MVGRYHVEPYTSGGHKYYRLARSYRDENGRPRKERLVHLGKAKIPEEALAAIEVKLQRLYESKHYDRLVEAESDVKRLEAEIKEIWGAALEYWHGGKVPSVEDAMYLRRVGRRRQKVTDPRRDVHWGYNVTWLPRPEHRLHVTPNIIENREPLHYEYKNYADDFEVDETEEYTSMRFWDFIASLRDLERARAAAAEARAVFEEKKHKLEKRMHELEPYVGL